MRAAFLTVLVVTPMFLISSCNDKKDSGSGGGGAKEDTSAVTAGTLAVVTGQIQPADGADLATIDGATVQAEGHPEISAVTDDEGNFTIENVLPGTVALYVGSNDGDAALTLDDGKGIGPTKFGLKITDVVLKSGEVTDLGQQPLKMTGGIAGKVVFYSNPNKLDLTGSEIFIPGTGFIVKTDAAGAFSLSGLPPGKYNLRAQHTGFSVLDVMDMEVLEGQTVDIGNLALSISTGPEGSISVVEDLTAAIAGNTKAKVVKTRSIKLNLKYDSDAALMKVADEPSFTNKEWESVKNHVDWEFKSDGLKTMYVMYSDLNGLESSPYKDEVYIDTVAPTLTSARLLYNWSSTAGAINPLTIVGKDSGTGIADIMSSLDEDFDGAEWVPFTQEATANIGSTSGLKTVYVKVRDHAQRNSGVVTDVITKAATTTLPSTVDHDVILRKAQAPFLLRGDVTINGDVTIEPGVEIQFDKVEGMPGIFTDSSLKVKGALIARGTGDANDKRVRFTGLPDDPMNVGPDCEHYIDLRSQTNDHIAASSFDYALIRQICRIYTVGATFKKTRFVDFGEYFAAKAMMIKTGDEPLVMDGVTWSGKSKLLDIESGGSVNIIKNSALSADQFFNLLSNKSSNASLTVSNSTASACANVVTESVGRVTIRESTVTGCKEVFRTSKKVDLTSNDLNVQRITTFDDASSNFNFDKNEINLVGSSPTTGLADLFGIDTGVAFTLSMSKNNINCDGNVDCRGGIVLYASKDPPMTISMTDNHWSDATMRPQGDGSVAACGGAGSVVCLDTGDQYDYVPADGVRLYDIETAHNGVTPRSAAWGGITGFLTDAAENLDAGRP